MRKLIAVSIMLATALAFSPSEAVVPGANVIVATVSVFVVDDTHVVSAAPVQFINLDPVLGPHDVTSIEKDSNRRPVFQSALIGPGVTEVDVSRAEAGKAYAFKCSVHPQMVGTLTVVV